MTLLNKNKITYPRGDFFLDSYLTEGRSAIMSRMMVFYIFPVFMTSALIIRALVLINRANVGDKDLFNARLDRVLASSHVKGLLVFPEGTRNLAPASRPLKKGMLVFAYSRKVPVQLVITANKERVLGSEKRPTAHWGQRVWTAYSPVIRAEDHASFDDYWAHVQKVWAQEWERAYSADPDRLPELQLRPPLFDYPFRMRFLQLASVLSGAVMLAIMLALTGRVSGGAGGKL
jgi:hypothetical protein